MKDDKDVSVNVPLPNLDIDRVREALIRGVVEIKNQGATIITG